MMLLIVYTSHPEKWGGFTPFLSTILMSSASCCSYLHGATGLWRDTHSI